MGKKVAAIAAVVLIAAAAIVAFRWGLVPGTASGTYYTQIDNAKIESQQSDGGVIDFTGGMPWRYTLTCYNEDGDMQELSFGTDRQLREGAYLRLEVVPVRGVTEWSEVQFDELPAAMQPHVTR